MEHLLWYTNQAVISSDVDVAVGRSKGCYIQGWKSLLDHRPVARSSVVHIQSLALTSGQNKVRYDQHGVGIYFKIARAPVEGTETAGAIQAKDARAVRP